MPDLVIHEVRRAEPPAARIGGFSMDAPTCAQAPREATIPIDGWVIGGGEPVTAVLVFCQGALLRTAPVNVARPDVVRQIPGAPAACGFSAMLTVFELPGEFELHVAAAFADGTQVPLAVIAGRHGDAGQVPAGYLRPLMITSLGRTGTTYLMRLLSGHPQVVAERKFPYETHAAAYWTHLLRVLVQPESPHARRHFHELGDWPRPPYAALPAGMSALLAAYVDGGYAKLAAGLCHQATEEFYRRVAAAQEQPDPAYFCEKFLPSGLQIPLWNAHPQAREIFLVRDFRDMVRSALAFNAKRGTIEFGRERAGSDEEYILELRIWIERLLRSYQARRERALLVYYEDLVRRPADTLRFMLNYLGLDASAALCGALVESALRDTPELEAHRTSPSPEQSIGRWRSELPPALRQLCRAHYDDLLKEFGYRLNGEGTLIPEESPVPEPSPPAKGGSEDKPRK